MINKISILLKLKEWLQNCIFDQYHSDKVLVGFTCLVFYDKLGQKVNIGKSLFLRKNGRIACKAGVNVSQAILDKGNHAIGRIPPVGHQMMLTVANQQSSSSHFILSDM